MNTKDAWTKILNVLPPKLAKQFATEISTINSTLSPSIPITFWSDPTKREETRAKMKEAWAARRIKYQISWRASGRVVELNDFELIGPLLNTSPKSAQLKVYKGKGTAHFRVDDDVVTVSRLSP